MKAEILKASLGFFTQTVNGYNINRQRETETRG
jgi:hypothetical protein